MHKKKAFAYDAIEEMADDAEETRSDISSDATSAVFDALGIQNVLGIFFICILSCRYDLHSIHGSHYCH